MKSKDSKVKLVSEKDLYFTHKGSITKIVGSKNKIENIVWFTHSENINHNTTKQ